MTFRPMCPAPTWNTGVLMLTGMLLTQRHRTVATILFIIDVIIIPSKRQQGLCDIESYSFLIYTL